jgi:hypothetical protein
MARRVRRRLAPNISKRKSKAKSSCRSLCKSEFDRASSLHSSFVLKTHATKKAPEGLRRRQVTYNSRDAFKREDRF